MGNTTSRLSETVDDSNSDMERKKTIPRCVFRRSGAMTQQEKNRAMVKSFPTWGDKLIKDLIIVLG